MAEYGETGTNEVEVNPMIPDEQDLEVILTVVTAAGLDHDLALEDIEEEPRFHAHTHDLIQDLEVVLLLFQEDKVHHRFSINVE